MDEKKFVAVGKEVYKVENGRVYIESEEVANAIQDGSLELFVDEEIAEAGFFCNNGCPKSVGSVTD